MLIWMQEEREEKKTTTTTIIEKKIYTNITLLEFLKFMFGGYLKISRAYLVAHFWLEKV